MTIQKEISLNKLSSEAKRLVNLAFSVKDNRRCNNANFDDYNFVYDNGKDLIFATDTKQTLFIHESTGDRALFNKNYAKTDINKVEKSDVYKELLKHNKNFYLTLYHNKRALCDITLLVPFYKWVVFVDDNSYLIPKNEYKDAFELPLYSMTNDLFLKGLSHSNTLIFDIKCFKNLLKFANVGNYADVRLIKDDKKSYIICEHKKNHFCIICENEPSVSKKMYDRKNTFIFSCHYESEIRNIAFVVDFLNKNARFAGELKREKGMLYIWRGYDSKTKEQKEEFSFRLPALDDFTDYFLKNIFKGNER